MSKAQISGLELTTYKSFIKSENLSPWINYLPKLCQKRKPRASNLQPTKVISKEQISHLFLTTYQSYIQSTNLSLWINYLPK